MHAQADTQQRAELRLAFLRHLPKRAEAIARRGRRYCREGWDINGLSLLFDDVQRLAGVSGRYGVLDVCEQLHALESLLAPALESETLPDPATDERVLALLDALAPSSADALQDGALPTDVGSTRHSESTRVEIAPPNYWRRWAPDAAPAEHDIAMHLPTPAANQTLPPNDDSAYFPGALQLDAVALSHVASSVPDVPQPAVAKSAVAAAAVEAAPATIARQPSHRIYHLTDSTPLAVQLDQRLEALGYELELLESGDELREVLAALAPDAVIVDASFKHELESIGTVMRSTRERSGTRIALLALSDEDSLQVRLAARRAGADTLLIKPASVDEVIGKLRDLLSGASLETSFRILVVEDDRSQALFAESILRNAGMEALVVTDAFEVLAAMERFKPDLVLMDLYMPQCDGTELTALIREREEFLNTPIVFLSGESDQDKHYEALSVGGDDFLSKPIRPKYLIASVNNRVQRARALQQRVTARDPRDPATGLFHRAYLLDRLNDALGADDVRTRHGGVQFLEIDGVATLRERLGLSGVEQLLADAAVFVVGQCRSGEFASRYGDGVLVIFSPDQDDATLESSAFELRRKLIGHAFSVAGQSLRVRASIGVCALRHGFADAGAMLNAVERASREARGKERGVHRFEPPRRAEDEQAAALVASIRSAIENESFELLYQPIVALQGGDTAQYQTLLRLRDDVGRLHPAAEIVPLAVRSDLILEVDRWVLVQALRVIEQRRTELRPVKLFVSQSATGLLVAGQSEWIAAQLHARRIEGPALVIELSLEDVALRIDAVREFCAELVPAGVQFCLSRYESGMEGDSILEQLPVDFIKLAPRYLGAAHTPRLRDELRLIVDRAHRRGLSVIAQRVEDAQSAATLWMSGIDYIQGNLVQLATRELDFDFQSAVL
jgi:diguanylate cyclase (GGDEF)-like protein